VPAEPGDVPRQRGRVARDVHDPAGPQRGDAVDHAPAEPGAGRIDDHEVGPVHPGGVEGGLDPASLAVTGIDPYHPLRPALPEKDALQRIFREVRQALRAYGCRRAILVGHNAAFDLAFLNAAVARSDVKRNPFHPFSCFDTATLAGVALGQTVLAKAVVVAGMEWDSSSAHSAAYDAELTAELFCRICNRFRDSYREAEERARALGWLEAPPTEAVSEDPQMET